MDYKYIEQLLEKYWQCHTSASEEEILKSFFNQSEIPVHLQTYQGLFAYKHIVRAERLGKDFDQRLLSLIEHPAVKAKPITWRHRFLPLLRAAAIVTVVVSLAGAMQQTLFKEPDTVIMAINTPLYEINNVEETDIQTPEAPKRLASGKDGKEYYLESLDIIDKDSNRFDGFLLFDNETGSYHIKMKKKE